MRKTILVLALALVVPPLAYAALPAKNSAFRYCETENSCPLSFNTSTNGRYVKKLAMYNKCAQIPANYPRIRVRDTGRFRKSGTVKDVVGNELTYTIKGRFRRPKKAVGTFEIDSKTIRNGRVTKRCDADPERFVARRVGKAA